MTLAEYVRGQVGRPFAWGVADCATFIIGWCDLRFGGAGLAAWTGRYADEASCEAFIDAQGGFTAIAGAFLAGHYGLAEGAPRAAGNPVFAAVGPVEAMGLRLDESFLALRTLDGVRLTRSARILAEWGLPCPR